MTWYPNRNVELNFEVDQVLGNVAWFQGGETKRSASIKWAHIVVFAIDLSGLILVCNSKKKSEIIEISHWFCYTPNLEFNRCEAEFYNEVSIWAYANFFNGKWRSLKFVYIFYD